LQGVCGDVEFHREYRQPGCQNAPIRALTESAIQAIRATRSVEAPGVSAAVRRVALPVRRWTRRELEEFTEEARYRLATGDTNGWLSGIASKMVNQPARLPERYGGSVERAVAAISRFAVDWADETLPGLDNAPLALETEVQALRVGDVYISANASELFSSLDADLRRRWSEPELMIAGYANGAIGYLPDAFEIAQGGYAAVQSPKGMRQQPFTESSGSEMTQALLSALESARRG
jgi:hypothetical protein